MQLSRNSGEASTSGGNKAMWKDLWHLKVPGKVKQLISKCLNNILPTKDNLFRKNIIENNLCPICEREIETSVHVLWDCSIAVDVWGGMTCVFSKWKRHFSDFQLLWSEMIVNLNRESLELASVMLYHLWARSFYFSKPV